MANARDTSAVRAEAVARGDTVVLVEAVMENPEVRTAVANGPEQIEDHELRASLAGAVSVLERDVGGVLGGHVLEYDEMANRPTHGRKHIQDVHRINMRLEIERRVRVTDSRGREKGLRLTQQDSDDAILSVASRKPFHPVREHLRGLPVWDGKPRLQTLPDHIQCEATAVNIAMLRRFFVGAVARVMEPGCKLDTVLIFVGAQGIGKSTFFRILAGVWFSDSAVDVHSKDSYLAMENAWILEWAELDSLNRREAEAVKAFLTSSTDMFRRPFGRIVQKNPRSSVIVGTTNAAEFLNDETGARRFWPLRVGQIDMETIRRDRDQLWAEALAAYDAGESWWLTADEASELLTVHSQHAVCDAWENLILTWAQDRLDFSTGDVLASAITKPTGLWSRADEMRVSKILRRAGFQKTKVHPGRRVWRR